MLWGKISSLSELLLLIAPANTLLISSKSFKYSLEIVLFVRFIRITPALFEQFSLLLILTALITIIKNMHHILIFIIFYFMFFSDPTMHLCRSLDNYPMNVVFWFRDLNSMNYWILSVNQFLDDDLPLNFLYMKISFDCWLHRWLSYSSIFLCKCISSTFLTLANLFHPHSFTSRIKLKFIFVQRSDNQRDQTLASFSPQQFNLHCEYQWFFCLEHKRCKFFCFCLHMKTTTSVASTNFELTRHSLTLKCELARVYLQMQYTYYTERANLQNCPIKINDTSVAIERWLI